MKNQKTILLLEDEAPLRAALKKILESQNYIVFDTDSISQCRKLLFDNAPDLLVMDVVLPDGNSIDLLKEFADYEQLKYLPILLMSGQKTDENTITKAYENGAMYYIVKPIQINDFIDKISFIFRILGLENSKRMLESQYNYIYMHSNDPICTINNNADIVSANAAFGNLCSYPPNNIKNLNLSELLNDENRNIWSEMFNKIKEFEQIPSFKLTILDFYKNNSPVEIFLSKSSKNDQWEDIYMLLIKDLRLNN